MFDYAFVVCRDVILQYYHRDIALMEWEKSGKFTPRHLFNETYLWFYIFVDFKGPEIQKQEQSVTA